MALDVHSHFGNVRETLVISEQIAGSAKMRISLQEAEQLRDRKRVVFRGVSDCHGIMQEPGVFTNDWVKSTTGTIN